jgi:hypothetical protein
MVPVGAVVGVIGGPRYCGNYTSMNGSSVMIHTPVSAVVMLNDMIEKLIGSI